MADRARAPRMELPAEALAKLLQIHELVHDVLGEMEPEASVAPTGARASAAKRPRRQTAPYRPETPVSETDRAAAARLLSRRGFIKVR